MKKLLYYIPSDLSSLQREEFLECMNFLSKKVIEVIPDKDHVTLYLENETDLELDKLRDSLNVLIKEIQGKKAIKEKIIKSNLGDIKPTYTDKSKAINIFYAEEEIFLLELLDKKLINIAKKYNSVLRKYKNSLNEEIMDKSNYNNNFPQNIGLIFDVPHDYNHIEDFRKCKNPSHAEFSKRYLQPCICYHCYDEWSNSIESKVITARGTCYRHEVPWKKNKFRNNEFEMREIVFIGTRKEVHNLRESLLNEVWDIFNKIGLSGKVVTANDPFFFNENFKKGLYQKLTNSKYELLYSSKEHGFISIASFNFCDDVVCKSFDVINSNSEPFYSGCVAFGLDRWVTSIMEQHEYKLNKVKCYLQEEM